MNSFPDDNFLTSHQVDEKNLKNKNKNHSFLANWALEILWWANIPVDSIKITVFASLWHVPVALAVVFLS